MNRKFNPVIAVGAGLLVVGIIVLTIFAARGGSSSSSTIKVLVATADFPAGTSSATAPIAIQDVKRSDVPPGAVASVGLLANETALAKVAKGQVITLSAFGTTSAVALTPVNLPKGKEAVGVELGFAPGTLRYVTPGNKITIWVTQKNAVDANGNVRINAARQLLADVLVLRTTPGTGDGSGTAAVPGPGTLDFLLALSHEDTGTLVGAASQNVNLYFSLSSTSTS